MQAFTDPPKFSGGAVGKDGLAEYRNLGFVSQETGGDDHISRTLDFGFADFSTSRALLVLSEYPEFEAEQEALVSRARELAERSDKAYQSMFDARRGLMVARSVHGRNNNNNNWFNDVGWGNGYMEGNAWHHSFPPYALKGLINLHGGQDKLLKKLHDLLARSSDFGHGSYRFEIHEMTEMRAGAMGQYAHNNQPSHHLLYLFAQLGEGKTTQKWVRDVMERAYGEDFYAGDEDNGEQGAWFVLSSLGLYVTTPGTVEYVIGSPLFQHVKIFRANAGASYDRYDISKGGIVRAVYDPFNNTSVSSKSDCEDFEILAPDTNIHNVFVNSVYINDVELKGFVIEDSHLQECGGKLTFVMEKSQQEVIDNASSASVDLLDLPDSIKRVIDEKDEKIAELEERLKHVQLAGESSTRSLIHSPTFTRFNTHSLAYLLTYLLTCSLTHSLTHSHLLWHHIQYMMMTCSSTSCFIAFFKK